MARIIPWHHTRTPTLTLTLVPPTRLLSQTKLSHNHNHTPTRQAHTMAPQILSAILPKPYDIDALYASWTDAPVFQGKAKDDRPEWGVEAYVTSANYQAKKFTFLLFINRK